MKNIEYALDNNLPRVIEDWIEDLLENAAAEMYESQKDDGEDQDYIMRFKKIMKGRLSVKVK